MLTTKSYELINVAIPFTIDYRVTYIYGIRNGCVPLIVLHWAGLIPSPEYIAFTKIS